MKCEGEDRLGLDSPSNNGLPSAIPSERGLLYEVGHMATLLSDVIRIIELPTFQLAKLGWASFFWDMLQVSHGTCVSLSPPKSSWGGGDLTYFGVPYRVRVQHEGVRGCGTQNGC